MIGWSHTYQGLNSSSSINTHPNILRVTAGCALFNDCDGGWIWSLHRYRIWWVWASACRFYICTACCFELISPLRMGYNWVLCAEERKVMYYSRSTWGGGMIRCTRLFALLCFVYAHLWAGRYSCHHNSTKWALVEINIRSDSQDAGVIDLQRFHHWYWCAPHRQHYRSLLGGQQHLLSCLLKFQRWQH